MLDSTLGSIEHRHVAEQTSHLRRRRVLEGPSLRRRAKLGCSNDPRTPVLEPRARKVPVAGPRPQSLDRPWSKMFPPAAWPLSQGCSAQESASPQKSAGAARNLELVYTFRFVRVILARGRANLLGIFVSLTDDPRRKSKESGFLPTGKRRRALKRLRRPVCPAAAPPGDGRPHARRLFPRQRLGSAAAAAILELGRARFRQGLPARLGLESPPLALCQRGR